MIRSVARLFTAGLALAAVLLLGSASALAADTGDMVEYPMVFPVDGENRYSDTFWAARSHGFHGAQDLFAEKGTPVVAVASGTVRYVNWSSSADLDPDRCCSVVITHDDGWESQYLHLDNDSPGTDDGAAWGIADGVVPGSRVAAGQVIGWVGDSGNAESTTPHLHFALLDPAGVTVNPFGALQSAETATAAVTSSVLRLGDTGPAVEDLQRSLAAIGVDAGPIDGIFGPMTHEAVVGLQTEYGLAVDGVVGSQTTSALTELLSFTTETLRRGDRGLDVQRLQMLLDAAGYSPGPVDGIFGSLTLDAVVAFQRDQGLAVDGLVGPQTFGALTVL